MKHYADLRIADTKKAVDGVPYVGAVPNPARTTARGR
jgi:hypothetical protein